jgi:Na+/H+-dicarboxylate symporter
MSFVGKLNKITLSRQILFCLLLGLLLGLIFGSKVAFLKIFGDIFIKLIKMVIVPLTFVLITDVFMNMSNVSKIGKIALKCMVIYFLTTIFSTAFGIFIAEVIKPGVGVILTPDFFANSGYTAPKVQSVSFVSIIVGIFPSNIVQSFYNSDILQILIFASFFGLAINKVGNESAAVSIFIKSLTAVVMKIIDMVIKLTPIGVLGIVSYIAGTQSLNTILSLGWHFIVIYGSILFIMYIFYGILLGFFGLNPFKFFKKVFQVQYFTFLTASSAASIPLSKITCERKLGVSSETSSFAIPLGASFNMNGTALHLGATSVFLAQVFGASLGIFDYIQIVVLSMILTLGIAGIPGASLVAMPMILSAIGVPVEYIAVYIGIDRFLDMARSSLNVTGDIFTTLIVDKTSGELDKKVYDSSENPDVFQIQNEQERASDLV